MCAATVCRARLFTLYAGLSASSIVVSCASVFSLFATVLRSLSCIDLVCALHLRHAPSFLTTVNRAVPLLIDAT